MNDVDFSGLIYYPDTGAFYRVKNPFMQIENVKKDGYSTFKYKGKKYLAHRVAWFIHTGGWPVNQIDHINGNRSDNRIANLRDVDNKTNMHNQKKPQKGNKSGFLGVFWNAQRNNWTARICLNKKRKYLGGYSTASESHFAYLEAKRIYHPSAPVN